MVVAAAESILLGVAAVAAAAESILLGVVVVAAEMSIPLVAEAAALM